MLLYKQVERAHWIEVSYRKIKVEYYPVILRRMPKYVKVEQDIGNGQAAIFSRGRPEPGESRSYSYGLQYPIYLSQPPDKKSGQITFATQAGLSQSSQFWPMKRTTARKNGASDSCS